MRLVFLIIAAHAVGIASAFYVPGTFPPTYNIGDPLQAEVTRVTSPTTELPYDYYELPFCKPKGGVKKKTDNVNIGTILMGIRPHNSPYDFNMKEEKTVVNACPEDPHFKRLGASDVKKLKAAIKSNYRVNMNLDNMPLTSDDLEEPQFIHPGYELGFQLAKAPGQVFVNNHLTFLVEVHRTKVVDTEQQKKEMEMAAEVGIQGRKLLEAGQQGNGNGQQGGEGGNGGFTTSDTPPGKWIVVGFEVQACSFKHDPDSQELANPQEVCGISNEQREMGSLQEVVEGAKVVYSYTVGWTEKEKVEYASRWDHYLRTPPGMQKVHWINILNSMLILVVMMVIVAMILLRTVRRDLAQYEEFLGEDKEESGWKMVAGDVFRAPRSPRLFCVQVGTGLQIILTSFVTTTICAIGFLSPAYRGWLLTAMLLLYMVLAVVGGYGAVRSWGVVQRTYDSWTSLCLRTACFFPGIAFLVLTLLNVMIAHTHSSGAIPVSTYFLLLALWFIISIPMTYLGGYLATRHPPKDFPVRTNQIPRHIPPPPLLAHPLLLFLAAGLLPFGTAYIELFIAMTEVWGQMMYYLYGFMLLVVLLTTAITVEVSILCTYVQLCAEDYHWWWRSFKRGGCMALYVAVYSIVLLFSKQLKIAGFLPIWLYLSYMGLVSLGLYLALGTVGFVSSYVFVYAIFATVKAD